MMKLRSEPRFEEPAGKNCPGKSDAEFARKAMNDQERLDRWRAETPGCDRRIHFNNAGAGLMPLPVVRAVQDHLRLEAEIGGYEAAEMEASRIADAYAAVASLITCAPRNVAIVENATVAFSQALSSFDWRAGDRIVTSRADYASNQIMYISLARRLGVEIVHAADLPTGGIDPDSVRDLLRARPARVVAITWVPSNSGLIQDVYSVGSVCADAGVSYLVDGCQAVGQLPVDFARLRCDFLAGTARKFMRGPRGIGFLAVSDSALDGGVHPLYLDMRGAEWVDEGRLELRPDARRFENWEFSYALVLGMGEAARYAAAVGPEGFIRARDLAARLREELSRIPKLRVLDRGSNLCANVTVEIAGRGALEVRDWIRERGVNTTAQERSDALLDMRSKKVESLLRMSPHYYNSEEEVSVVVELLREFTGRSSA